MAVTRSVCKRVTSYPGGSTPCIRLSFHPDGSPAPAGRIARFVSVCASTRRPAAVTSAPRRSDRLRGGRARWDRTPSAGCVIENIIFYVGRQDAEGNRKVLKRAHAAGRYATNGDLKHGGAAPGRAA